MHHRSVPRYLVCPRCRLSIQRRRLNHTMSECPRCMVQAGLGVPLFASRTPVESGLGALEGPVADGSAGGPRVGRAA
jgi:hypothetical protein